MSDVPVDFTRPEGDESSAGPPPPWIHRDGTPDLEVLATMREQAERQVDL